MKSKLTFLILLLTSAFSLHAFKLTPAVISITPGRDGSGAVVRVENNTDAPAAIQFSVLTREMDIEGRETTHPADEDFIVYPPQTIIEPRETQTVRIRWVGESIPDREISYRFLAEQLPVRLTQGDQSNVNLNLVVRILGSLYVRPADAEPEVKIESVSKITNADGREAVEFILSNEGTAHTILGHLSIDLTSTDGDGTVTKVELPEESLPGFNGENVLRESRRRFVIPWPAGLGTGELRATLDFDPQI